jgi:hypothetical protein
MRLFAPIVEGHGEVDALPALLYRIARAEVLDGNIRVNQPIRVKSGSFLNDQPYFYRHFSLAAAKAAQSGGSVLILLDCDDDCPAKLGPDLLRRAMLARPGVEIYVALANREFESWFIAAATSLSGACGLAMDLQVPVEPTAYRNAKGWLGQRMDRAYNPVAHQLELVRRMDLQQARANRSFDRLYRYIIQSIR